jgi:dTDP-4-dehydrorhamnose 3,5-epimerase
MQRLRFLSDISVGSRYVIVSALAIADVLVINTIRHSDSRGWFSESYKVQTFQDQGMPAFVQENEAMSFAQGTVRGLHFQRPPYEQAKLVRCVSGAVYDVAVDLRPHSKTFGRHVAVRLDADSRAQLFIPAGFAHGYCTLAADTVVQYKVSAPYAPDHEGGILWNDPALGIDWPVSTAEATLGAKDGNLPKFAEAML